MHLSPSPATKVFMCLNILLKTDVPGQNTAGEKHDACLWLHLGQLLAQISSASFFHSLQCTQSEHQSQQRMKFILHPAASLSPARHSREAFTPAMLQTSTDAMLSATMALQSTYGSSASALIPPFQSLWCLIMLMSPL